MYFKINQFVNYLFHLCFAYTVNNQGHVGTVSYLNGVSVPNKSGARWLNGRVLDSRPKGRGFEPHRRHRIVVLEQDTFILA